ncbi:MAG: hypothetical protein ACRESG_01630 [Gammaproteobacteria bacterium]
MRLLCLATGALLLAACAARHPQTTPQTVPAPPHLTASYAAAAMHGVAVYRLDPDDSQVLVLVDKAGALADFGHIHVIAVGGLRGFARVARNRRGAVHLAFPLRALVVDPPAARSALGGEYAKTLSPEQRQGTRRNMLGASVLDAARYPWVKLTIAAPVTGTTGTSALLARISMHGVGQNIRTTGRYSVSTQWLLVAGDFKLRQSDFDIQPYSALLGALRVADEIEIRYHLAFKRWCPSQTKPLCSIPP